MSQAGSNGSGGGGGGGITTIDGDTGSVTGSTVTIFANQATLNAGSSVSFSNSGATSTFNVTDGSSNTIVGLNAGVAVNTASSCTGLGAQCLASITDDDSHVAVGRGALQSANDASSNTAIGAYALNSVVSGGDNTAIGAHSGISLASGSFNTLVGYFSGTAYTTSESSNILLGNVGVTAENNTIRIGTQGLGNLQQNVTFVAGITGTTPTDANSPQVTVCDNTGNLTVVPDTTAGYVLTSNSPNSPTFQPAPTAALNAFSAVYTVDQSDVTGDGTQFVLIPDTTLVSNGFSYNNATGVITVNNTGTYSILCRLLLTGIDSTHNSSEWLVYTPGPSYIAIGSETNLYSGADVNTQYPASFNTVVNLTASTTFNISFQANSGDKTIGTTNSSYNTNFIQVLQIG